MYHTHFALEQEPFGVTPDCRFFYQSEQHMEALASLYYAIEQRRGFALLVGRAGLGKTSILVHLIQWLEGKADVAFLPQVYFDQATVLDSILISLGLPVETSPAQNHRAFYEYLMKLRVSGKTCVVIFDEAQGLNHATLEAIRMLSNFETQSEKLVQIVLAGQPQLTEALRQPDCEQLRQRLNVIARLEPMGTPEVSSYILHRLKTAGGTAELFTPEALDAIAGASDGVLRNVNTICFNALTIAYALGRGSVGTSEVAEVLRDLSLSGHPMSDAADPVPAPTGAGASSQTQKRSWSVRVRLPAKSFRSVVIAASLILVAAGALVARSVLLALR